MAKELRVKIVEQCQVCAAPNSAASLIPLTFFDLPWLFFPPAQPLFFYPYPFPTCHFLSTTLPALNHSLSLTLQLFFPFAAHLVFEPLSKPNIAYNHNDCYVSLTVAESSNADFQHISANHPRHVKDFHPLLPSLQSSDENQAAVPLLAVKVTVFPNSGLCLGLAYHHVAADGRTFDNFIKTWASFHRDSSFPIKSMPSYDRTVVIDKHGLEAIFLNEYWRKKKSEKQLLIGTESELADDDDEFTDKVRATFVMGLRDIEKIKGWIVGECKNKNVSEPVHLSPYVVVCAFVWICLMKALTEDEDDDELEHPCYFGFNAGGLNRLDYPVPATYMGNCVGFGRSEATREELMGENGIIIAAKAIGDTVKKLDKALLGEAERWISEWEVFRGTSSDVHNIMVVGSPKLDVYETDFGWGRPTKIEEISIDRGGAISLTESRDEKGGIEVGLALPNPKMDAFASLFAQRLKGQS